jgi:FixJ family two-component response regulator
MHEEGLYLKHKPLIAGVDDDQSVREALENLISSVGFEVNCLLRLRTFSIQIRAQTDLRDPDVRCRDKRLELQQRLGRRTKHSVIIITAQVTTKPGRSSCSGRNCFSQKPVRKRNSAARWIGSKAENG